MEDVLAECVVLICRELRAAGHVAGVPDAKEAVRLACDLGRLRGLAAPGRQELLEGLQTALAQGEVLGRGRALAKAMEEVLVGWRRGYLARPTRRNSRRPWRSVLLDSRCCRMRCLPMGVTPCCWCCKAAMHRARMASSRRCVARSIQRACV